MAPTDGMIAKPERRWGYRQGTPHCNCAPSLNIFKHEKTNTGKIKKLHMIGMMIF